MDKVLVCHGCARGAVEPSCRPCPGPDLRSLGLAAPSVVNRAREISGSVVN